MPPHWAAAGDPNSNNSAAHDATLSAGLERKRAWGSERSFDEKLPVFNRDRARVWFGARGADRMVDDCWSGMLNLVRSQERERGHRRHPPVL